MKKLSISILCLAAWFCSTELALGDPITLHSQIIDETPIYIGYPKAPIHPLTIDVTGHTLTLLNPFVEIVPVELLDKDENVVYTDCFVPGQTSLVFPTSLTGEYIIRLTVGSIYYIGVIEL